MIKLLSASAILALSLSSCTGRIDEHGARYRTDDIVIQRDRYDYHDGHRYYDGHRDYYYDGYPYNRRGSFCPPGHAKKGWC